MAEQVLKRLGLWGWVQSECGWKPFWIPLPRAARALKELVKCECTKSCATNAPATRGGECAQPIAKVEEWVFGLQTTA